jgi:hypothetical protein
LSHKKDAYLGLTASEQSEALLVAASETGRAAHLLEKDIWVVWALDLLFTSPFGERLVFKGGTSLSKAYGIIDRFSEDIDLTYDVRGMVPDLVGDTDGLPPSKSQAKNWTKEIRKRLPIWITDTAQPYIDGKIKDDGLTAKTEIKGDKLIIHYPATQAGTGYVKPEVELEFGARSTGEPTTTADITCDAAKALDSVAFPTAHVRAMKAERTFWEKATAIHVFCLQGQFRGRPSFARHWFDLAMLDKAGVVDAALKDRDIGKAVAEHKTLFFRETLPEGGAIDYADAVEKNLKLVPTGKALKDLTSDYAAMLGDGLLGDNVFTVEQLLESATDIQGRANK